MVFYVNINNNTLVLVPVFKKQRVIAMLILRLGQKGTKTMVEKYGDARVCICYRYDEDKAGQSST